MGRSRNFKNPNGFYYKAAKKLLTDRWLTIRQMIDEWPLKRGISPDQLSGGMRVWPLEKRDVKVGDPQSKGKGSWYIVKEFTWDVEKESRWEGNMDRVNEGLKRKMEMDEESKKEGEE